MNNKQKLVETTSLEYFKQPLNIKRILILDYEQQADDMYYLHTILRLIEAIFSFWKRGFNKYHKA